MLREFDELAKSVWRIQHSLRSAYCVVEGLLQNLHPRFKSGRRLHPSLTLAIEP